MAVALFPRQPVAITADLKRAAEYKVGHALTEREAHAVIEAEVEALILRLSILGRWIDKLGSWEPRVRVRGMRTPWRSVEQRARASLAQRERWARQKARKEA